MKALTLANIVTLSRLFVLGPAIYFLLHDNRPISLIFLGLVLVGDLIDGAIARARNEVSELGKVLDPIVDKIVFFSVFIVLVILEKISLLALVLLLVFQIGIMAGSLYQMLVLKVVQPARALGKIASAVIAAGLVGVIVQLDWSIWIVYAGIALGYLAGLDYFIVAVRRRHEQLQGQHPPDKTQTRPEEAP